MVFYMQEGVRGAEGPNRAERGSRARVMALTNSFVSWTPLYLSIRNFERVLSGEMLNANALKEWTQNTDDKIDEDNLQKYEDLLFQVNDESDRQLFLNCLGEEMDSFLMFADWSGASKTENIRPELAERRNMG